MARGLQQQAQQTYGASTNAANNFGSNANQLYSQLFPDFMQEYTNPQGFGAQTRAGMNTASQQSVGGSTAGAVGEGNLESARTRNSGGFTGAEDEAVRSGERQLSSNALDVQNANAGLEQEQKQAGLAGLGGLYGQNSQDMLSALGLENQSTNTGTQAGNSGWFQNMTGLIGALRGAGGSTGGGSFTV